MCLASFRTIVLAEAVKPIVRHLQGLVSGVLTSKSRRASTIEIDVCPGRTWHGAVSVGKGVSGQHPIDRSRGVADGTYTY